MLSQVVMSRTLPALIGLALLVACGGASPGVRDALAQGRIDLALAAFEEDGKDGGLQEIAREVLVREARADDLASRGRALGALRGAGTHARAALERLAQDSDAGLQARARSMLAALGDEPAREALRAGLEADNAVVLAAAVSVLNAGDPEQWAALQRALRSGFVEVRLAAPARLRVGAERGALRAEVMRMARADPVAAVRAAAVGALPALGEPSVDAIEAALTDAERPVRMAAYAALIRADRARAEAIFLRVHSGAPSADGIESARLLLSTASPPVAALAMLERALAASDGKLRSRAATALAATPHARLQAAARARLADEPARSVRLALALALPARDPLRREQLVALAAERDLVGTQAVAELARGGDAPAVESLISRLEVEQAAVRRVAVRTLARDLGQPRAVRKALLDDDASVRVAAAAAILARSS